MSTDAAAGKKVILKSSDGETFEVDEVVALESQTIKDVIEVCGDSATGIPLPNVSGKILLKVIEYCKKHVNARKAEDGVSSGTVDEDLKLWDAEFVKVDLNTLFDLILAANYLNIKSLLDLTCQTVADMIKGKTPEEIRKTFNIKIAAGKKVILKSSDGETFEVDEVVALESQTIKDVIEVCGDSATGIPLPNVSGKILLKVIEYCKKHVNARKAEDGVSSGTVDEDLKLWDAEFVKVDLDTLFDLILAANYLNIKSLLDLTCQTVADMIKGKTPEDIRKTFNIKDSFTPEDEDEVRRENQWAFE